MTVQKGKLIGIARKGKPRVTMEELEGVEIGVAYGLEGDWRGPESGAKVDSRQVSVMAIEDWNAACADVGRELPWTVRRANLLVERLALKETEGALIQIGDVILRVIEETAPCSRMDEQVDGLKNALMADWRGGVCCTVENGGIVKLGNVVAVETPGD